MPKPADKPMKASLKWILLAGMILIAAGAVGGYLAAKSNKAGLAGEPERSARPPGRESSPRAEKPGQSASAAGFDLSSLHQRVNCTCGSCENTLAACGCDTAKRMKAQIALAAREYPAERQMLDFLVERYGLGVLAREEDRKRRLAAHKGPRPAIAVEPASHDFGRIPQEVVSHRFAVRNLGDADLIVERITTSCGCTTAEIDRTTIPPGGSGILTVTFDPKLHDTVGATTRTVSIETNDPVNPVKRIALKSVVYKTTAEDSEFPAYAYGSSSTLEAYRIAKRIPGVLERIPCYCGCGTQSGHRSLKDCFIAKDGSFDRHGSGCKLCNREALDVAGWHEEKVPIREIRRRIDEKYRRFGRPTPTPPM